jgi:hypothetical protein
MKPEFDILHVRSQGELAVCTVGGEAKEDQMNAL